VISNKLIIESENNTNESVKIHNAEDIARRKDRRKSNFRNDLIFKMRKVDEAKEHIVYSNEISIEILGEKKHNNKIPYTISNSWFIVTNNEVKKFSDLSISPPNNFELIALENPQKKRINKLKVLFV